MHYDKKIRYLDYCEEGERVKGAGYVKLEERDGMLRMELTVTGLRPTDSFDRDLVLCSADREEVVDKIVISGGRGQYRQHWRKAEDIAGSGIGYRKLRGIRIPLGGGREISCMWQALGEASGEAVRTQAKERGRRAGTGQAGEETRFYRQQPHRKEEAAAARDEKPRAVEESGTRRRIPFWKEEKEPAPEEKGTRSRISFWKEEVPVSAEEKEPAVEARGASGRNLVLSEEAAVSREEKGPTAEKSGSSGQLLRKEEAVASGEGKRSADGEIGFGETERNGGKTAGSRGGSAAWVREESSLGEGLEAGMRADGEAASGQRAGRRQVFEERGGHISENGRRYGGRAELIQSASQQVEKSGKAKLLDDKWSQLWAIYPHINPFRDEREYLSVGPADFVLFSAASYKQVNNSFLLHGYYNYQHLILTKMERKGEISYYIGVPGAFFEREKQVAIMFGFESFECAEEPAQTGDFGYYMMRIWL